MKKPSLLDIAIITSPTKLDHSYIKHLYPVYMEKRRDKPIKLLELGIKRGNSLRMWRDYFLNGTIVGIDTNGISGLGERIHTYAGKAQDHELLARVHRDHGPFDFVVDDASHRSRHQIPSFRFLFPRMAPKGAYFCEDLHFHTKDELGAGWNMNGTDHVVCHPFVDYINWYTRFTCLSYKHWKRIKADEEELAIGTRMQAIHWTDKLCVVERNGVKPRR